VRSKLPLQHHDNRVVPGIVEILFRWRDIHLLARAATIGVGRGMERLMDIADEMDEKRKVTSSTPFIVIAILKATGVLVDFSGNAVAVWAAGLQVLLTILKAQINVVPRRG
jgi:hypothetical protein